MTALPAFNAKYARLEVERRWRLDAPASQPGEIRLLEDGYIAGTRLRLRRVLTAQGHVVQMKLTQKIAADAAGSAHWVTNAYLSDQEFARLQPLVTHRGLKRRHRLQLGEHLAAIEEWLAPVNRLVLAEVEFADDRTALAFTPPAQWRDEVTLDRRYSGAALCGLPAEGSA